MENDSINLETLLELSPISSSAINYYMQIWYLNNYVSLGEINFNRKDAETYYYNSIDERFLYGGIDFDRST